MNCELPQSLHFKASWWKEMLMLLLLLTISLWRCHRFVYLPQSRAWEMQFSARPMWQRVDARPQSRTANTDRWYSSVAVRSVAAAGPWSKTIAEPRKCPWNSDRASFAAGNSRRHPVQGWKGGREREREGVLIHNQSILMTSTDRS